MANGHLALVAYRATIGGAQSTKLDIKVLWFSGTDEAEVRELVMNRPVERYVNDEGLEVCWHLVELLHINEFDPTASGEEVIGFMTSTKAFPEWDRTEVDR